MNMSQYLKDRGDRRTDETPKRFVRTRGIPTAERLRELIDYNSGTGELIWRPRSKDHSATRAWNTQFAGKPAGSIDCGYIRVGVDGAVYRAHHLAWLWMTGEWPSFQIDHVNSDGFDNRWSNLRLATQEENTRNAKRRSDNTSGFKGVHWRERDKKWNARIWANGKRLHLGSFETAEAAHAAYCVAAKTFHGDFARTN